MFSESQCAAYCKVLARGVLIKEGPVHTKTEAEDELRKTDRMQLCAGAVRLEDYDEALFTTKLRDHVLTRQGLYFSRKCLGQVPKEGTPCVSCRYLRRALLTRRSRVQRRNTKARLNIAQKLKTAPAYADQQWCYCPILAETLPLVEISPTCDIKEREPHWAVIAA
ncbi:hypothetical protein MRX96_019113 [Rhipicephalus microplus]